MKFDKNDTAVVMIDPQNEVLSETGLGWPQLRESLHENNTIENMERIFKAAKEFGFEIFISPHYLYPTDKGWKFKRSARGRRGCFRYVLSQRSLESRWPRRLRCRLAEAF